MGFLRYKKANEDKFLSSLEEINEDFSVGDLVKVGTLISKMATRRLAAGKFTYLYTQDFKKSTGELGRGALFVSQNGIQMRYNFLQKTKKGFSVNSIDYWASGKKIGDAPSKSIYFQGENIVKVVDQLFDFLKTGKLVEGLDGEYSNFGQLFESTAVERRKQRELFAAKHGISSSKASTAYHLRNAAEKSGLLSKYNEEFGGNIEVKSDVQEVTSTDKEWRDDQKKFDDPKFYADPEYVFTDMEEAAKVVARGKWRSAIFAGMGGIGKCLSHESEINVIGL